MDRLRTRIWITESHVWYELDLPEGIPRIPLPGGLRLVRAQEQEVERLAGSQTRPETARERLRHATDWWIVLDEDDELVFSCWTFHAPVPVLAARTGVLPLPEFIACVVDPVSAAGDSFDLAPAAWGVIAGELAELGVACLIARAGRDDVALRRALTQTGFRPYAIDHHRRRGFRRKVTIWTDGGPAGEYLVAALPAEPRDTPAPDPNEPRDARAA